MKKLIPLIILTIVLTACSNDKENQQASKNLDDMKNQELNVNINPEEKVEQAKKELEDIGLTGQELEDEVYKQKVAYEQLANLSGDAKNSYILQNQVLPKILKTSSASKCKNTTDIDLFTKCMVRQNIKLEDIKKQIPEETKQTFEKKYYGSLYSHDKRNLLGKTSNPIAIEEKKDEVLSLAQDGMLNKGMCKDLPEKKVKNYCTSLFEEE